MISVVPMAVVYCGCRGINRSHSHDNSAGGAKFEFHAGGGAARTNVSVFLASYTGTPSLILALRTSAAHTSVVAAHQPWPGPYMKPSSEGRQLQHGPRSSHWCPPNMVQNIRPPNIPEVSPLRRQGSCDAQEVVCTGMVGLISSRPPRRIATTLTKTSGDCQ